MGPNKFNLTFFNLSVPLVQSSGNRYSKGIKIIEYRWIPFFKPDEEFIATMALLEFDLGYISVPQYIFPQIKQWFEENFLTDVACSNRKCSVKKTCDETIGMLRAKVPSSRQQRLLIVLENYIGYYIPFISVLHQREEEDRPMCDFLIQGHNSQYQKTHEDYVILGRPFFMRFYTFFNY